MLRKLYENYDFTIMDIVLIVFTCGLWLLWAIPRNIYRRDRNKKYAQLTVYQTHKAIRNNKEDKI